MRVLSRLKTTKDYLTIITYLLCVKRWAWRILASKSKKNDPEYYRGKEDFVKIFNNLKTILRDFSAKTPRNDVIGENIEKYEELCTAFIDVAYNLGKISDDIAILIEGYRGQIDFLKLLVLAEKAETPGELRFMLGQAFNAGTYAYHAFEKVSKEFKEIINKSDKLSEALKLTSTLLTHLLTYSEGKWWKSINKIEKIINKLENY